MAVNTLSMSRDGNGMEVLSRVDCLQLLSQACIGRISVSMRALPVVLPVNFALFDGDILLRIGRGTKLETAAIDAVVAFEIDGVDPIFNTGWSVLVQGMATKITDQDDLKRAEAVPLNPWAGPDDHYLRISAEIVSGRRLTADIGLTPAGSRP
jgi:nitroimidazol reductase NimA-like FMN-containing flavoprotein (pyridoxamine 5'-phosphate oxidase superfamily)